MVCGTSFTTGLLKTRWLFPIEPLRAFRNEHLGRQAESLAKSFRNCFRQNVALAQNNPLVLAGRRFFKNLPQLVDPRIDICRRELLALKLGISSDVFTKNPGFEKFATDTHLERYLMEYQHSLHVDPHSEKVSILSNGEYMRWEETVQLIESFPKQTGSPILPWVYGQKGLQSDDMYNWSKLKPYKRTDASEWGFRYIFELAVCCADTPHKTGDHGWLRLKTPEGDVYSVGLYRPGKRSLSDNWKLPFRLKHGHLMMPDVSEFWPCEIRSLKIRITEQQFYAMVSTIEFEKTQDQLIFQLFQSNCVLWAQHIAESVGVKFPYTGDSCARLLVPRCIEPIVDACYDLLPSCVKKVSEISLAIIFNTAQIALGAGVVDKEVKKKNGSYVQPHISSISDIFKPSKMNLHHPYTFGNETLPRIEGWRVRETALLEQTRSSCTNQKELDQQIDDMRYTMPPNPEDTTKIHCS
jgi:hypothetical protein